MKKKQILYNERFLWYFGVALCFCCWLAGVFFSHLFTHVYNNRGRVVIVSAPRNQREKRTRKYICANISMLQLIENNMLQASSAFTINKSKANENECGKLHWRTCAIKSNIALIVAMDLCVGIPKFTPSLIYRIIIMHTFACTRPLRAAWHEKRANLLAKLVCTSETGRASARIWKLCQILREKCTRQDSTRIPGAAVRQFVLTYGRVCSGDVATVALGVALPRFMMKRRWQCTISRKTQHRRCKITTILASNRIVTKIVCSK